MIERIRELVLPPYELPSLFEAALTIVAVLAIRGCYRAEQTYAEVLEVAREATETSALIAGEAQTSLGARLDSLELRVERFLEAYEEVLGRALDEEPGGPIAD